jgi:hypothetical protein
MKTLYDSWSKKFIRTADSNALRLTTNHPKRFSYAPKWLWKVQEGIPYRGQRENGSLEKEVYNALML